MSERPTPETDAEVGYFDFDPVSADFARRLERERDEAREDATNYYARIGELERERDEAIFVMRETRRRLDDAWLEIERLKSK